MREQVPSSKNSSNYGKSVRNSFLRRTAITQFDQDSNAVPTQEEIKNQQYQQDQFEATKLQIQAKHGTITPDGQERLNLLQAKKAEFWQRYLGKTEFFSKDFSQIPLHSTNTDAPPKQAIQAKLTIGEPGDKYEQEADRVAAQVVNQINSTPPQESNQNLQREELPVIQTRPWLRLQAKNEGMAAPAELESSIQQARSSGQPLADNVRKPMEHAFGFDFSGVKVHTDAQADKVNQSIQARAFTTGQDVFFRHGEYNPGSRAGQELLAHELTHVVQQNIGQPRLSKTHVQRYEETDNPKGRLSIDKKLFVNTEGSLYASVSKVREANDKFQNIPINFESEENEKMFSLPRVKVKKKAEAEVLQSGKSDEGSQDEATSGNAPQVSKISELVSFVENICTIETEEEIRTEVTNEEFNKKPIIEYWNKVFNDNIVQFGIQDFLEKFEGKLEKFKETMKRWVEYLEEVAKPDKVLLPSDCGLMAQKLLNIDDLEVTEDGETYSKGLQEPDERVSKVEGEGVMPGQAKYVKGEEDESKGVVYHWGTVVMTDDNDYVTLEAAVAPHTDMPKLPDDNSWKFTMYSTAEGQNFAEQNKHYFVNDQVEEQGTYEKKKQPE